MCSATHPSKECRGNSEFVGKVGDSMARYLTPRKYVPFTNKWGDAWAIHFDDTDGNRYLTFSSSRRLIDKIRSSIGKPITLKFTVAGQEIDRGLNVNRIKVVEFV